MLLQKKKSNQKKVSSPEHGYLPDNYRKRHLLNFRQDPISTISTEMRGHFIDHLLRLEDPLAFLYHGYYPITHMGVDLLLKLSEISSRALMQFRRSG